MASNADLLAQTAALTSMMADPTVTHITAEVHAKIQDLGVKYPAEFTADTYKADVRQEFKLRVMADRNLRRIYRDHLIGANQTA